MTRGNRIAKEMVLLLALACAVGLGFGRMSEDLCAAAGSYADDPGISVASEYALPARPSFAENSANSAIARLAVPVSEATGPGPAFVPRSLPIAGASVESPRRC